MNILLAELLIREFGSNYSLLAESIEVVDKKLVVYNPSTIANRVSKMYIYIYICIYIYIYICMDV